MSVCRVHIERKDCAYTAFSSDCNVGCAGCFDGNQSVFVYFRNIRLFCGEGNQLVDERVIPARRDGCFQLVFANTGINGLRFGDADGFDGRENMHGRRGGNSGNIVRHGNDNIPQRTAGKNTVIGDAHLCGCL